MNAPKWADLLVDIEREFPSNDKAGGKLAPAQVDQLKAIENASYNFNISMLHGVAAMGELLAHASTTGGLDDNLVHSAGWLINSLSLLSMTMTETGAAASYKLANIPHKGGQQ